MSTAEDYVSVNGWMVPRDAMDTFLKLEESGVLDEAEKFFDLEEEAERTGDYTELNAYLGEAVPADEVLERLRISVEEKGGETHD